jgi:transcriptional regulator with XRE-family HTH domain
MADNDEEFVTAVLAVIRGEIAASGSSMKEISRRIGRDYGTIRKYLIGERPLNLGTFYELCEAIGVAPEYVIRQAVLRQQRSIDNDL